MSGGCPKCSEPVRPHRELCGMCFGKELLAKYHADRCATCGMSASAWDDECDFLMRKYEDVTHAAVLAERERVLKLIERELDHVTFTVGEASRVAAALRRIRKGEL